MLEAPILAGIQVRVDGLRVARCDPPLSAGSSPTGRAVATGALPDLLADRPLTILGEWHGPREGAIHVSGRTGDGPFGVTVDVAAASTSATDAVLRQLWARRRIEALTDQAGAQPGEALVKEITDLGLRFQLLTEYTSFLAVDEVVTSPGKKPVRVVQPLVLPEGVTEMATAAMTNAGSTIPAAPEPELLLMLSLAAGLLVVAAANRQGEAA
jgi:Ca-activated chloride channel family protein